MTTAGEIVKATRAKYGNDAPAVESYSSELESRGYKRGSGSGPQPTIQSKEPEPQPQQSVILPADEPPKTVAGSIVKATGSPITGELLTPQAKFSKEKVITAVPSIKTEFTVYENGREVTYQAGKAPSVMSAADKNEYKGKQITQAPRSILQKIEDKTVYAALGTKRGEGSQEERLAEFVSGTAEGAVVGGVAGPVIGAVGKAGGTIGKGVLTAAGVVMVGDYAKRGIENKSLDPKETGNLIGFGITAPITSKLGEKVPTPKAVQNADITISKIPKPVVRAVSLPVGEGKSKVASVVLAIESGSKSRPLASITEGKIGVGTPTLNLEKYDLSKGVIKESPTEAEIFQKSLRKAAPVEAAKFEDFRKVVRHTEFQPSAFVKEQFVRESKVLSPAEIDVGIKFAKANKAELYGSFPSRSMMPEDLARKPGDIDMFVDVGGEKGALLSKDLTAELNRVGEGRFRVSKQSPTLIEKQVGKNEFAHAYDIHTRDSPADIMAPSIAQNKAWGFKLNQPTITIEKVQAMPLSEQGVRKGASIFTLRDTPFGSREPPTTFAPEAHRTKDIPDFFATQEALIRSMKAGADRAAATSDLARLRGRYPKDLTSGGEVHVRLTEPKAPSASMRLPPMPRIPQSAFPVHKSQSQSIGSVSPYRASPWSPRSASPSQGRSPGSQSRPPSSDRSPSPPSPSPSRIPSPKSPSPSKSPPSRSPNKSPSPPSPPRSPSPSPRPRSPSLPSIPPIPLPSGGGGGGGGFFGMLPKQEKEYTPSFAAIALNIRSKKKPGKKVFSGIEIRPIIR